MQGLYYGPYWSPDIGCRSLWLTKNSSRTSHRFAFAGLGAARWTLAQELSSYAEQWSTRVSLGASLPDAVGLAVGTIMTQTVPERTLREAGSEA